MQIKMSKAIRDYYLCIFSKVLKKRFFNLICTMNSSKVILFFIFIFQLGYAQRARDPWVFRTVLDEIPRAITFALNKDLWAAYDTKNCKLIKLWKGGINFRGEVYNGEKVNQPTSYGFVYHNDKDTTLPIVTFENGNWVKPNKLKFVGHIIKNDKASIIYEIESAAGLKAIIEETPEFVISAKGEFGFQRIYNINSNPSGLKIGVKIVLSYMHNNHNFKASSVFLLIEKNEKYVNSKIIYAIQGILELEKEKPSEMIHYFATY